MTVAITIFLLQVLTPVDAKQEVVVLVNENVPESGELGRYYATRRGIPQTQILSVKTAVGEVVSWADYRKQIEEPLRTFLESRPKTLYIVPIFGIPVKTKEENSTNDRKKGKPLERMVENRDYCCIDREMELIPKKHPLEGWIQSSTFRLNRPITRDDEIYIVCRLDGPSVESVRAMIDNAIHGDTYGIQGTSLLDTRGLTKGGYASIDVEMKQIAQVYKTYEIPFRHDDQSDVVPLGTHENQAHYWGWYTAHVKATKDFRFNRGAVGAHLHSYSARNLRSTKKRWTGPLVHYGITATCGTVYEPLASGFPYGTVFFDRFFRGYNFGQAMQMANMFTSWMAVFVGDPLYAPYAEGRAEAQAINRRLAREGPTLLEKALDEGREKEASTLAAKLKALGDFPDPEGYIWFLIRETRARALSEKPTPPTIAVFWNRVSRAVKESDYTETRKLLLLSPYNFECNRITGEDLLRKKKAKSALEHLRRANEVDPENARVRHLLGKTLLALQKYEEAFRILEEAYSLGGEIEILLDLGRILLAEKRYDEVVTRLEPVTERSSIASTLVGRAYLENMRPAEAVKILEKAIKRPSASKETWSTLSRAYRQTGNRTEATKASKVAKSFSLRKRADKKGSRRGSIQKRIAETFEMKPDPLLSPRKEEISYGLPVLLLANKSGWTIEILMEGPLVYEEKLRSLRRPKTIQVPLYPGKTRVILVARKGKEEKIMAGEIVFELNQIYSYGFESLEKLYPLQK